VRTFIWLFLVALLGSLFVWSEPVEASPPCSTSLSARACAGAGRVSIVTGSGKAKSTSGGSADPVTTKYVACNEQAEQGLRTAGDRDAQEDAELCASSSNRCAAVAKSPGADPTLTLAVAQLALLGGAWQVVGDSCTRPPQPVVTAAAVRAQAVRLIPSAAVGLAPHGSTLVNIQTVVWVDAPVDRDLAAVRILGRAVRIHTAVDHVVYDFGDGVTDQNGPVGTAYTESEPCRTRLCPGYYGHVYTTSGMRTLTATVYWKATFTVDGGNAVAIPGLVAGPTTRAQLAVHEARAVLVPNP
jgi:hypothetical protein